EGIYRALRQRRTYATSGPRILLRAVFGGYRMGAEVPLDDGAAAPGPGREVPAIPADHLFVQVFGTAELDRIDLVRSGELAGTIPCEGLEASALVRVADLRAGEYLYVRAVQHDDHFAVASPFFFVEPAAPVGAARSDSGSR
ncbi:MAG: DUF3604 domain-containing protein, partial [Holophagales bacterium]|nr:DUF3604 domain-containing protein [Holophagales bacterium]